MVRGESLNRPHPISPLSKWPNFSSFSILNAIADSKLNDGSWALMGVGQGLSCAKEFQPTFSDVRTIHSYFFSISMHFGVNWSRKHWKGDLTSRGHLTLGWVERAADKFNLLLGPHWER